MYGCFVQTSPSLKCAVSVTDYRRSTYAGRSNTSGLAGLTTVTTWFYTVLRHKSRMIVLNAAACLVVWHVSWLTPVLRAWLLAAQDRERYSSSLLLTMSAPPWQWLTPKFPRSWGKIPSSGSAGPRYRFNAFNYVCTPEVKIPCPSYQCPTQMRWCPCCMNTRILTLLRCCSSHLTNNSHRPTFHLYTQQ